MNLGPLPLLPNQPTGSPDWYSTSGTGDTSQTYGGTPQTLTAQSGLQWYPSQAYGQLPSSAFPSNYSPDDIQRTIALYDRQIGTYQQAMQQSSGLERRQIEARIEDMVEGRKNAMAIAQLQDQTSRYGVDATTRDRLAQLQENQRQFDQTHGLDVQRQAETQREYDLTHGLDVQRFGLDQQRVGLQRAQTATDYLSRPDRFVQAGDFLNLSGRVMAGQPGAGTGGGATAVPKTMADFSALEGGGNPGRQLDSGGATSAASAGGSGADARVKALRAVIDAAPPSNEPGLDNNAYHVLNAAKSIYSMNLTPEQQASIGGDKQYQQILGSAGERLGQDPTAWWQKQQQSLPGQGATGQA